MNIPDWRQEMNAFRAGLSGMAYPTPKLRALAAWFRGFASACALARVGVSRGR